MKRKILTECLDAHGAADADPAGRHDRLDSTKKLEAFLAVAGFVDRRCWVEQLVQDIDAEQLVRLRTSLGSMKPPFDSLSSSAQAACLADARSRMAAMPSEALIARAQLIYPMARV